MKKITAFIYMLIGVTLYSENGENSGMLKGIQNQTRQSVDSSTSGSGGGKLSADEVEIDLSNESLKSEDGVNIQYGDLKIKAYEFQKDEETNTIKTKGDVYIEIDQGNQKTRMDAQNVEIAEDGSYGKFYGTKSYVQVGHVTGGEWPNDKIFFGGETTEYKNGHLVLTNSWFSTDPKVLEVDTPFEAGYHLSSKEFEIIPDKQANFKWTNLYIGKQKILPFRFPWYAINIRPGSEVPVFPMWGSSEDYGGYRSWGILYGDANSKYKGGFAPKHADKLGFMVGRWENELDTKLGTMKLNVTDALVDKRNETIEDRWKAEYTHDYESKKGHFNFNFMNSTQNMVSALEEIRDDNEDDGKYDPTHPAYLGYARPDGGEDMNFYTLDTEFKELGEREDISFYGKVKLLDDKESYKEVVDDRLKDIDYDSQGDHDLFSEVGFTKDNEDYKIGAYYEYLDDMDPGSSQTDLRSKAENFGFELEDKRNKLYLSYDEKNEDEFRGLRSWERTANLDKVVALEYNPWTVAKYDTKDSKNLKVGIGGYQILESGVNYKASYNMKSVEKELSLQNDPFRNVSVLNNERDKGYNKFEEFVYENKREDRIATEMYSEKMRMMVAGGYTEEEIWDREGLYNYATFDENTAYKKYVNESEFVEGELDFRRLKLGILGEFMAKGNLRFDEYDRGYDQTNQIDTKGGDSTLRQQVTLGHTAYLFDNTNDKYRIADLKLKNDFTFFYQDYTYDEGDSNLLDGEELRLKHKDRIEQYKDTVTFNLGNTETAYTFESKEKYDLFDEDRIKQEEIKNTLEFGIDDTKTLAIHHKEDLQYTNENDLGNNYNDFTNRTYGVDYYYNENKFYYKGEDIHYNLRDFTSQGVDDANERIHEDIYGYEYSNGIDKLNLEYTRGRDDRYNLISNQKEIAIDNKIYSVSYLNGGDVEHYYKATYEEYNQEEDVNKQYSSDVVSFRYEYRDKRLSKEDLEDLGASEFDKSKDELTPADIERVKEMLQNRGQRRLDFNLQSIKNQQFNDLQYKKSLKLYLMLQRNKQRYRDTGDYFASLEEMQGSVFMTYNRFGLGYEFDQKADWKNYGTATEDWVESERDHELSLQARIGKPSEGWRVKTFVGIHENLNGDTDRALNGNRTRRSLDRIGFEIGKEKGYYMWSTAFAKKYVSKLDRYEWEVALQFTLLTFPNMPIFGGGFEEDTKKEHKYKPYLFDGVDPDVLD